MMTIPRSLPNPNPRPPRRLTDAEREAILAEIEVAFEAVRRLPITSKTVDAIYAELRDGLPPGTTMHPLDDDDEEMVATVDDAFESIFNLKTEIEEALVNARAQLRPWKPR